MNRPTSTGRMVHDPRRPSQTSTRPPHPIHHRLCPRLVRHTPMSRSKDRIKGMAKLYPPVCISNMLCRRRRLGNALCQYDKYEVEAKFRSGLVPPGKL